MSTGAEKSRQYPTQKGPGTSVPTTVSKNPSAKGAVQSAGNASSGTNQGSSRGPQGNK